jgi:hypothetical protein
VAKGEREGREGGKNREADLANVSLGSLVSLWPPTFVVRCTVCSHTDHQQSPLYSAQRPVQVVHSSGELGGLQPLSTLTANTNSILGCQPNLRGRKRKGRLTLAEPLRRGKSSTTSHTISNLSRASQRHRDRAPCGGVRYSVTRVALDRPGVHRHPPHIRDRCRNISKPPSPISTPSSHRSTFHLDLAHLPQQHLSDRLPRTEHSLQRFSLTLPRGRKARSEESRSRPACFSNSSPRSWCKSLTRDFDQPCSLVFQGSVSCCMTWLSELKPCLYSS